MQGKGIKNHKYVTRHSSFTRKQGKGQGSPSIHENP